jgi:hypothetical protein
MLSRLVSRVGRVGTAVSAVAIRVQAGSRDRKWELYEAAFPPRRGERVLDLGASALDDLPGENYFLRRYPYPEQVTAVGIDDFSALRERYADVTFVTADGRDLPFADAEFDIVHSNAVIEHVGDRAQQQRFVDELVRVARAGFVTTPNRWFPIETHCKLPLLHWLPRPVVSWLARVLKEPDLRWWLLGARAFRGLFPAGLALRTAHTRVLLWPVTLIVVYRRHAPPAFGPSKVRSAKGHSRKR